MNKIVRDHYPVEKLPADLREGLGDSATVKIVIEAEAEPSSEPKKLLTIEETLEMIRRYKELGYPSVSSEEAVARIRELRDEWDY